MCISRRRHRVFMPQQCANNRQTEAAYSANRRVTVSQVMNAHAAQFGLSPHARPNLVDGLGGCAFARPDKNIRIVFNARQFCQNRQGRSVQINDFCAGFAVRQPVRRSILIAAQGWGAPLEMLSASKAAASLAISTSDRKRFIFLTGGFLIPCAGLSPRIPRRTAKAAIVKSTSRPQTKCRVFKIPHHGSVTGHSDDVWTQLLDVEPIAVTTPYDAGRKPLPTSKDIARISTLAGEFYLTSSSPSKASRKRAPAVEKTIREVGKLTSVASPVGIVRLRNGGSLSPNQWTTEFSGLAHKVA